MFLVQNIYFPYNTIKYFEYGQDLAEGSLAEWSKALVLGTSPKGRGFESHSCQRSGILRSRCKKIIDKIRASPGEARTHNPGMSLVLSISTVR